MFVPPGWDERYVTAFGSTLEEVFAQGAESMEGRLRAAGLDPLTMRLGLPFDLPPLERARRGLTLLRAGYLGEPNGPVTPDPEATAMLFDGLRRQIDPTVAPGPRSSGTSQTPSPGTCRSTTVVPSWRRDELDHPDLTFHCRLVDWVEIAAGRTEPVARDAGRQGPPERQAADAGPRAEAVRLGDAEAHRRGRGRGVLDAWLPCRAITT